MFWLKPQRLHHSSTTCPLWLECWPLFSLLTQGDLQKVMVRSPQGHNEDSLRASGAVRQLLEDRDQTSGHSRVSWSRASRPCGYSRNIWINQASLSCNDGQKVFHLMSFRTPLFPDEIQRRYKWPRVLSLPLPGAWDGCMEISLPGDPQNRKMPRLLGEQGKKASTSLYIIQREYLILLYCTDVSSFSTGKCQCLFSPCFLSTGPDIKGTQYHSHIISK